jgi:hypothetical protein
MTPRQAIRNEGKPAEQAFLRLVKNALPSDVARRGDAIVSVDGASSYVEIKHVTSNTINQVRAVKFIPLVIYSPQFGDRPWAVLPAQEVVRLVLPKARGQHTEIALECANLSLSCIAGTFRCTSAGLDNAVQSAVRTARKYPTLERILHDLVNQLSALNAMFHTRIEGALRAGN